MPSQQEVRWSQLKIGVIVLVSAVILTTLLFLMTASSGMGLFSRKMTVTTYLQNAGGLKVGAAVELQGVTIGNVKSISVTTAPEHKRTPVAVVMKLDTKYQYGLHKDSSASLSSVGLLGDPVVDIDSSLATGPTLQDGDEVKAKVAKSLSDVEDEGEAMLESFQTIVANLQAGKGTLGQLLVNPDMYNKFDAIADDIHNLTLEMNDKNNTIGKLINDHGEMYGKVDDTIANIDSITADLQAGKGTAGMLLKDPTAANNLNASLASLKSILADVQAGKGSAGMLVKDPAFATKLNESVTQLNTLLSGINAGNGTVGKLFKDDTMNTNINNLLTNSNDLITAFRKDPKKYLNLHLHIF
jgi:phospholipid/cholesterol/gamma-HCH transport system substrate-binding protein